MLWARRHCGVADDAATTCNNLQQPATTCNNLQQPATTCNNLQQPATTCNNPQQPATPDNDGSLHVSLAAWRAGPAWYPNSPKLLSKDSIVVF